MELFTKDEARTLRIMIKSEATSRIEEEIKNGIDQDMLEIQKKHINRIYKKIGRLVKENKK